MGKFDPEKQTDNVNVKSDPLGTGLPGIFGKEFLCPLCGVGLPILNTKRNKPYCTCNSCGIQIFVRAKVGISRLYKLAKDRILIS
jgi:hypothetical protein